MVACGSQQPHACSRFRFQVLRLRSRGARTIRGVVVFDILGRFALHSGSVVTAIGMLTGRWHRTVERGGGVRKRVRNARRVYD